MCVMLYVYTALFVPGMGVGMCVCVCVHVCVCLFACLFVGYCKQKHLRSSGPKAAVLRSIGVVNA